MGPQAPFTLHGTSIRNKGSKVREATKKSRMPSAFPVMLVPHAWLCSPWNWSTHITTAMDIPRGMVGGGRRADSLVKVMLKPLFPVEWSVWNSRRATWPLLVMEEGSWFPEKVPRTGASAVAPSLMTRKSN